MKVEMTMEQYEQLKKECGELKKLRDALKELNQFHIRTINETFPNGGYHPTVKILEDQCFRQRLYGIMVKHIWGD